MRIQVPETNLTKFPIHLTGVNPFWDPDSTLSKTPRLAAYRRYKTIRSAIEQEHHELGITERITLNKVFERMRESEKVGQLTPSRYPPKRYSKVMLYSIIEIFALVDSSLGKETYKSLEQIRTNLDLSEAMSLKQEDSAVIDKFLAVPGLAINSKLNTREALRDVMAFHTAG